VAKGILALMGSGETAPGMTKVHRELLAGLSEVQAANLDTTYGFQENVPQMTQKLVDYFKTSLRTTLSSLHFTSFDGSSELERSIFKQDVRAANYVFSGPGSPSFALSQWRPLRLVDDLVQVLNDGGVVCFASAAAVTVGAFGAPIYEIYKVGVEPYWLEGLNLTAFAGLNCTVVPHFDNTEGANYDTSRCYLGERRLALMESQLPLGVATLGIDEHTALFIDLERDTVRVLGKSHGYWRLDGTNRVLANGTTTQLDELRSVTPGNARPTPVAVESIIPGDPSALGHAVTSGGPDALDALARLVILATSGGEGFVDPTPLVEGLLNVRSNARANGQFGLADELRDVLVDAGIDIQDGPDGSTWTIKGAQ
jgi:peptidase E